VVTILVEKMNMSRRRVESSADMTLSSRSGTTSRSV
jgi:hypothetical protein